MAQSVDESRQWWRGRERERERLLTRSPDSCFLLTSSPSLSVAMQRNRRAVTTASTAGPVTRFSSGPSISSARLCWMTQSVIIIVFPPRAVWERGNRPHHTGPDFNKFEWYSNPWADSGACCRPKVMMTAAHDLGLLKPQNLPTQLFMFLYNNGNICVFLSMNATEKSVYYFFWRLQPSTLVLCDVTKGQLSEVSFNKASWDFVPPAGLPCFCPLPNMWTLPDSVSMCNLAGEGTQMEEILLFWRIFGVFGWL